MAMPSIIQLHVSSGQCSFTAGLRTDKETAVQLPQLTCLQHQSHPLGHFATCCDNDEMPEDDTVHGQRPDQFYQNYEGQSLLSASNENAEPVAREATRSLRASRAPMRRQSSLSKPVENGMPRTPRTPNRVRFDIEERESSERAANGHVQDASSGEFDWMEEEDYLAHHASGGRRSDFGQRAPLLTDIEAPGVTVAGTDFSVEDHLESARPKSGMRSAFMNMANSIM